MSPFDVAEALGELPEHDVQQDHGRSLSVPAVPSDFPGHGLWNGCLCIPHWGKHAPVVYPLGSSSLSCNCWGATTTLLSRYHSRSSGSSVQLRTGTTSRNHTQAALNLFLVAFNFFLPDPKDAAVQSASGHLFCSYSWSCSPSEILPSLPAQGIPSPCPGTGLRAIPLPTTKHFSSHLCQGHGHSTLHLMAGSWWLPVCWNGSALAFRLWKTSH